MSPRDRASSPPATSRVFHEECFILLVYALTPPRSTRHQIRSRDRGDKHPAPAFAPAFAALVLFVWCGVGFSNLGGVCIRVRGSVFENSELPPWSGR